MRNHFKERISTRVTKQQDLPAGDFSSWLRHTRNALLIEIGTDVDCEECIACCSSSQFIHIRPEENRTLDRIRKELLVPAPGLPKGHVLLGYDKNGFCPMMNNNTCSIYEHRPLTCRTYDCRVFAAAGINAGVDKPRINQRVACWKFNYPFEQDRDEHLAVQAAAYFIRDHADCFPGKKIPSTPSQLAILAVKVYDLFLKNNGVSTKTAQALSDIEIADAIVTACRKFDEARQGSVS